MGTPVRLETERLILRPFAAEDEAAFAAFAADPAYRRYLGAAHPDPAQFVRNNLGTDWDRELSWVICAGDEVIGSIFIGVDHDDALAEVACLLAPAAWGRGIAGEAGQAVVDYAFGSLGVEKVFARADARNGASCRAMEKSGMTREAVLPAHRRGTAGVRVDEVIYGLTRERWATAARPLTRTNSEAGA